MVRTLKHAIVTLGFILSWITLGRSSREDFCEWETFNATCGENEVIQMEHAHYGRMSLGRCIRRDYGYIGCHVDVLDYLDQVCSGRQSCQLKLPDENLATGQQPCPDDLESYIQLEYQCVSVLTSTLPCVHDPIPLSEPRGFLANLITRRTGLGSPTCPWEVRGSPGQRVRITLHDFRVWTPQGSQWDQSGISETGVRYTCHVYARITEGAIERTVTLCGGRTREQEVYLSETEVVKIAMINYIPADNSAYFLLHYEIVGCPEYIPPEGAVFKQVGNGILVTCPDTGREWQMSCNGTVWKTKGEIANCTVTAPSMSIGEWFDGNLTLPQWILVLIIIVIAVFIAVIIFVIGIVSLRRHREAVTAASNSRMGPEKYTHYPGYTVKEHYPMLAKNQRARQSLREREYTTTLHRHMAVPPGAVRPLTPGAAFPPLPSPPSFPDAGHCPVHGTPNQDFYPRDSNHTTFKPRQTEHIYESPKFLRRTRSESDTSDPFYHELDPDHTDFHTGLPREHSLCDVEELCLDTPVEPPPEVFFPASFGARNINKI